MFGLGLGQVRFGLVQLRLLLDNGVTLFSFPLKKCPQEFTKSVHENSPILSTKIHLLRPREVCNPQCSVQAECLQIIMNTNYKQNIHRFSYKKFMNSPWLFVAQQLLYYYRTTLKIPHAHTKPQPSPTSPTYFSEQCNRRQSSFVSTSHYVTT